MVVAIGRPQGARGHAGVTWHALDRDVDRDLEGNGCLAVKDNRSGCVVLAHHTPDVYGSDLQLLESASALVAQGWQVVVVLPRDGELVPLLQERGVEIVYLPFPALRRNVLSPRGLFTLFRQVATFIVPARRVLRDCSADALYVNTLIIPHWILAGRLARVPVLCHVHEAQPEGSWMLRAGLALPLVLADGVVVNSQASLDAIQSAVPWAARDAEVIYNGIPGPPDEPAARVSLADPIEVVQVGRLSPRKGTDVALKAVELLVAEGHDIRLRLAGDVFEGYEWYRRDLEELASTRALEGRVEFLGYVQDRWSLLAASDIVLVPSRTEPFGNTAVEAQLAMRPVIASGVDGLVEVVRPRQTGLLVPPDDPTALALAMAEIIEDAALRRELAVRGREVALKQFGVRRFGEGIGETIKRIASDSGRG